MDFKKEENGTLIKKKMIKFTHSHLTNIKLYTRNELRSNRIILSQI